MLALRDVRWWWPPKVGRTLVTEEERAVFHLLEDAERVFVLLRRKRRMEREEWRATWSPITMRLYELDVRRIEGRRAA